MNKLWATSFFLKCSKFNLAFQNEGKNSEKVFSFWDNCMWMGCIKLSLFGREHLRTAVIVLTNSLKLFHITIREFLPLNCPPVEQQILSRCCRSKMNRVETRLPCSFWKGNLKGDFLDICPTTFFVGGSLRNE